MHPVDAEPVFTPEFFGDSSTSGLVSKLGSLAVSASSAFSSSDTSADVHALTILARVAKEPAFAASAIGLPLPRERAGSTVNVVVNSVGTKLLEYAGQWTKGVVPERDVLNRKYEELVWMNSVIYGVGGWGGRTLGEDKQQRFNADFF